MTIKIFNKEIEDNIGDMVAKGSISYASTISKDQIQTIKQFDVDKIKSIASANPDQIDLYYKHSVLASVGWNKNDDVFDSIETWKARNTASDKQLNLEHNELDIIGHMTDTYVFDANGVLLSSDIPESSVPSQFDVVTEFVLYAFWQDEKRRKSIAEIISEIDNGNWYVSMECIFPAFDYAIIDKNGNHKTIARNEETAFLSKHLRAYGGDGQYDGYRVGRLLRNFTFSGQGLVRNPANERSIIFDMTSEVRPFISVGSVNIRNNDMELEKQIEQLKSELAEAKATISGGELAKVKSQLDSAVAENTELKASVDSTKSELSNKDKAIATFTEELKVANDKVTALSSEISAMKEEAKTTARKAKLASAGVKAEEIETTIAKWSSLDDKQFDEIVSLYAAKKEDMKDMEKEECESKKSCSEKTSASIQDAKIEDKPTFNQTSASKLDAVSNFLKTGLKFSAVANKRFTKDN